MYQKQHGNVNFEERKSTLQAFSSLNCFNYWQFLMFHVEMHILCIYRVLLYVYITLKCF